MVGMDLEAMEALIPLDDFDDQFRAWFIRTTDPRLEGIDQGCFAYLESEMDELYPAIMKDIAWWAANKAISQELFNGSCNRKTSALIGAYFQGSRLAPLLRSTDFVTHSQMTVAVYGGPKYGPRYAHCWHFIDAAGVKRRQRNEAGVLGYKTEKFYGFLGRLGL